MPKLTRKTAMLAKIETTYGVDSTPTGAANAILIKNLNVTPIAADTVGRDLIRPYLGEFDQLIANRHVEFDFEVEFAGSGTAGVAPGYGPLLRACGMAETVIAAAVTGSAQAGSANTITLAAGASSVNDIYNGLPISITSGTGNGSSGMIIDYDGTTKIATILAPWGVNPAAASGYSIGPGVTYKPISTAFESDTVYINKDGTLHKALGGRGSVKIQLDAKGIPTFKFNIVAVYAAPTDTALPTNVYTLFQTPLVANNANTTGFNFYGVSGLVLESLAFDEGNVVDFRALIGSEYVQITDRRSSGSVKFEAPSLSTLDVFAAAAGTTTGVFGITHGTTSGNKVGIFGSKIDIGNPSYEDSNGVVMISCPFVMLPTLGDDEFTISVF